MRAPPAGASVPSKSGKEQDADAVAPTASDDDASRARVGMEGPAKNSSLDGSVAQPGTDAGSAPSEAARPAQVLCRARMPLSPGDDGVDTIGNIYRTWVATGHAFVATDALGNVVIAGTFLGTIDLGAGAVSDNGADWAMFVAKFDRRCQLLWSHVYGAPAARVEGGPISIGPDNEIALGGSLIGSADFGTGQVEAPPGQVNGFLLKLRTDGTARFLKLYETDEASFVYSVAIDGSGDVLATGFAWHDPAFGDPPSMISGATLAKYSAAGEPIWTRDLPPATERVFLQAGADGTIALGGNANEALDWGDGTTPVAPHGDMAMEWLSQLTPDGAHRWSTEIAQDARTWGVYQALGPDGSTTVTYGLVADPDTHSARHAIDVIDAEGKLASHATWTATDESWGYDVATDSQGAAIELGITKRGETFGDDAFQPLGGDDVYVAKHDRAGHLIWGAHEGTDRNDDALGVTTDADGHAIVLWFSTDASYQTSDELVLLKLAP
jgi:hypothetical protein